MSSYNIYPELKRIIEDKRIKGRRLSKELYNDYLNAEQFILDCRSLTDQEINDMSATMKDLAFLGLDKPPCINYVLHSIVQINNNPKIISVYIHNGEYKYLIAELYEAELLMDQFIKYGDNVSKIANTTGVLADMQLIVMLATKGCIKEYHECKKSQCTINGKPHKKGSGGYTIIRPPEANEISMNHLGYSIRPHFRRGHIRRLDPLDKTKWIWVSPCFIHGETKTNRKAYLVK